MSEIPKSTYTEYALLLRAESAEFKVQRLETALKLIKDIVHTPTNETAHRTAERHFMADFDQIRNIIKAVPMGGS